MKYFVPSFIILLIAISTGWFLYTRNTLGVKEVTNENGFDQGILKELDNDQTHPLQIEQMRAVSYPGSDIVIEETLEPGSNYNRYYVSYKSEGLTIYGLLTVPMGQKPKNRWPVILFNHGYIPPAEYRTTERYIAHVDSFASNGYIVFRSDYRGHDRSEGRAEGGYGSPAYTVDVLHAVSSIKRYKDADPSRIGMWGHSMGGHVTARAMVVSKDIKAGVIWAGVVASYPDLLMNWRRGTFTPPPSISASARGWRQAFIAKFGEPDKNPEFWQSISPNSFVKDISGPVQLHHGIADESVPVAFSESYKNDLEKAGKKVEYYVYEGDDHNVTNNFAIAMQRSIEFFDTHVKQ